MATTAKKSDVIALAELFESLVSRADDPEVQTLFELMGLSDGAINAHRARMDKVEHYKSSARRLNEYEAAYNQAKDALTTAQVQRQAAESRITDLANQLNAAQSHNPPTNESAKIVSDVAPLLAQAENKLVEIENEISQRTSELAACEVNLIASQKAFDDLANPANLPLSVQIGLRKSRSSRSSSDDRLTAVQQLLTLGRAALRIGVRDYNVRAGDKPPVGALNEFYRQGGVPLVFTAPTCFNESGSLLHGTGLWTPFAEEINRMLSEVRTSVSALEVEESKLLAASASGFNQDKATVESVYIDDLRKELALV